MEYNDSKTARDLARRTREFMDEAVIPVERDHTGDGPVPSEIVEELRDEARKRGVYCPQISEKWGGGGEDFRDVLPLFEEAGRSLLGPPAMRIAAPDEGNMHTLERLGTERQKKNGSNPSSQARFGRPSR